MKEWFTDRPGVVALIALLAPLSISLLGFGVAGLVPDVQGAGNTLHSITSSLHLPDFAQPSTDPSLAPPAPDQVVPAGRSPVRVPILEYHYIRVNPDPRDKLGFNLSVTPDDFTSQMAWLKENGYHPIDLYQLRAYFQQNAALPPRPVVLTFDDGYDDFFTAAVPVLQTNGFTAVSYVVPGFLNRQRYMTTEQVQEIDRAGFEVAAHTLHHVDLTKASPGELALEVEGSRNALEQLVQHPVLDFCYPSGMYNATVVAAVAKAGFQSATTEVPGPGHTWADRLTWTRVRVNGGENLSQFVASLGEPEPTVMESAPPAPGT